MATRLAMTSAIVVIMTHSGPGSQCSAGVKKCPGL